MLSVRREGFEPPIICLEGSSSVQAELPAFKVGREGLEPINPAD